MPNQQSPRLAAQPHGAGMFTSRIEELAAKIRAADLAYYNSGEAVLEDAAYDALKDELRQLAPDHDLLKVVGAAASAMLTKVQHSIPMGSLDKAMNKGEFIAWLDSMHFTDMTLTVSLKMDGGSLSLEYQAGKLVRAVTRGDGLIGEDITANAQQFKNCPKKGVKIAGKPFTGFVRAEVMLLNDDWKKADPDLVSNPRNLGNGIARRKDGEQADLLSIYAFRAHFEDGSLIANTEADMLTALTEAGFTVSPWRRGNWEEVWSFYEETHAGRAALPFWIDGMVVKLDDIPTQVTLGERDQRPKGQIAIKFPATVSAPHYLSTRSRRRSPPSALTRPTTSRGLQFSFPNNPRTKPAGGRKLPVFLYPNTTMATYVTIKFDPKKVSRRRKGEIVLRLDHQAVGFEHAVTVAGTRALSLKEADEKPARNVVSLGAKQSSGAVTRY